MIGARPFVENVEDQRCPNCNGLMLRRTVANAKWLAGLRGHPQHWQQTFSGLLKKIYCCTACGSPALYADHDERCTLRSQCEVDVNEQDEEIRL